MQLTIAVFDDRVVSVDVDSECTLETLKAIVEAETAIPSSRQALVHNGAPLQNDGTLASQGVQAGDLLMLIQATPTPTQSQPSSAAAASPHSAAMSLNPDGSAADPSAFISAIKSVPGLMASLPPPLAEVILSNDVDGLQTLLRRMHSLRNNASQEELRLQRLAEEDPFNVEVQRQLEEAIRQKNVAENFENAVEYNPEAFGTVHMLYVNCTVNKIPQKAFIDSGAQMTVMNQATAEECGLLRLLDSRFQGMAVGVGSAKILGRIHMAPMEAGGKHMPISITVLENGPKFLFGLDNLKRHACSIDLKDNSLKFPEMDVSLPFLPEHEIPKNDLHGGDAEHLVSPEKMVKESKDERGAGPSTRGAAVKGPPVQVGQGASGGTNTIPPEWEGKMERMMQLGFSREQCQGALSATNGDEEMAASMLFGGF